MNICQACAVRSQFQPYNDFARARKICQRRPRHRVRAQLDVTLHDRVVFESRNLPDGCRDRVRPVCTDRRHFHTCNERGARIDDHFEALHEAPIDPWIAREHRGDVTFRCTGSLGDHTVRLPAWPPQPTQSRRPVPQKVAAHTNYHPATPGTDWSPDSKPAVRDVRLTPGRRKLRWSHIAPSIVQLTPYRLANELDVRPIMDQTVESALLGKEHLHVAQRARDGPRDPDHLRSAQR